MAKGKKSSGNHYTSKGERPNVARWLKKATRRDYMQSMERIINQATAHLKGKNTVVTIANPNKNETNKRFIKVSGKDYFRQSGKR